MIRLYDFWESGNGYKVRLLLTQLSIPFERVELDILKGETRTDRFRQKNPNHRIPLIEWPDGRTLAESNAILFFFADGTNYLATDPWQRAQTLQWMFFEQYSHEPFIAVMRFWKFSGQLEANKALVAEKMERGYHALNIMDRHLQKNEFFVAGSYSIADIALYAYTHVAQEGDFNLGKYAAINDWLDRVRAQPLHVRIDQDVGVAIEWSRN